MKMTKKFDKLDETFNTESEIVSIPSESISESIEKVSSSIDDIKKDYDYTRGNLYSIIEKGQEAINGILELAQESEMPRAYEVAGQLIKNVADATFGVAYIWKSLEAGLAIPQLTGSKIQYSGTGASSYYYMARHFLTSIKYTFIINEDQGMTAYPLVLIRYVKGAPVQYDINGYFDWKKYGWAGITYRSGYAIGLNLGFRVNNSLRAGYAYDYSINSVKNYIAGSHEFFLGYTFGRAPSKDYQANETSTKDRDSLMEILRISDEKHMEEIIRLKESIALLKKENDSLPPGFLKQEPIKKKY